MKLADIEIGGWYISAEDDLLVKVIRKGPVFVIAVPALSVIERLYDPTYLRKAPKVSR